MEGIIFKVFMCSQMVYIFLNCVWESELVIKNMVMYMIYFEISSAKKSSAKKRFMLPSCCQICRVTEEA